MITLKRFSKKILRKSLTMAPFPLLGKMSQQKILLPVYHTVSDEDLFHIKHLFPYRDTKGFKHDLDIILKHYTPVSLHELILHVQGKKRISKRSFLISFDDGYREVFDIIAPILKKRSIPAVFFLNTDFIDNKNLFFRNKASLIMEKMKTVNDPELKDKLARVLKIEEADKEHINQAVMKVKHHEQEMLDSGAQLIGLDFEEYLKEKKPYMDSDQVNELINQGFVVASHGIDHPAFEFLTLEEQVLHVEKSFSVLKENFRVPYNAFAFPFNENGISAEFYNKTHFNGLIDISFGTSGFSKGYCENNLQRQSMEEGQEGLKGIYSRLLREKIISHLK